MKAKIPMPYNRVKLRKEIDKELTQMVEETKRALDAEVKADLLRQAVETNAAYERELDALVLWTLHTRFGFGYKRLSAFHEALFQERKELHDRYLPSRPDYYDNGVESDAAYQKLRDFGYDVKVHLAELSKKYPIQTSHENEPDV